MDLRMEHAQLGLTIRIPPRTHRTCTLCKADYTVPLSDDPAKPQMRCLPCQKREKCSACRKFKKRKRFHKKNGTNSIFKTCDACRERSAVRTFQKRLQAESQGTHTLTHISCRSIVLMLWLYQLKASVGVIWGGTRFLPKIVWPKMGKLMPAAVRA